MEVHAHTHTPRKKWTHYFWEFLMLFLAVFCGFLAEYKLEHTIEHGRERQYLKLMIADLNTDTALVDNILKEIDLRMEYVDSMLSLLTEDPLRDELLIKSYRYTSALNTLIFSFNDRTIIQLKNSGNMRIISKQNVNDGIIHYWKHSDTLTSFLNRHMAVRSVGREMEAKIFNQAEQYFKYNRNIFAPAGITLIPHSPALAKEYANIVAQCGTMLEALKSNISDHKKLANELIDLIKREYGLN